MEKRAPKGFTLIELLVVIAIIALLMSIIVPALKMAKDKAKDVLCMNNLKQIGVAVKVYAEENKDRVPRASGGSSANRKFWQQYFLPYLEGAGGAKEFWRVEIYNCPAYPDPEQIMDYVVNGFKTRPIARSIPSSEEAMTSAILSRAKAPAQYIYIADYEDRRPNKLDPYEKNWIRVIKENQGWDTMADSLIYTDIWTPTHLPYYDPPIRDDVGRSFRVARARHRKEGANNLFLDTHVEWLHYTDNTAERWNVRGWE
jgi:prepilin-type N-terminal cleavage/methylation domain-containing protein